MGAEPRENALTSEDETLEKLLLDIKKIAATVPPEFSQAAVDAVGRFLGQAEASVQRADVDAAFAAVDALAREFEEALLEEAPIADDDLGGRLTGIVASIIRGLAAVAVARALESEARRHGEDQLAERLARQARSLSKELEEPVRFVRDLLLRLTDVGGRPKASVPAPPDAFRGGLGTVPDNPLLMAGLQAIWKGGPKARALLSGWREAETGRPYFEHRGKKGGRILVYPNPGDGLEAPISTTAEALWALVESLNPFTADVALAVLAQLADPLEGDRPKYPLLQPVRITVDSILRYKGIQRWGMERRVLEDRVREEMERLRTLRFDVQGWLDPDPATNKVPRQGLSWEGDRLFDIVKVEHWQEGLFGKEPLAVAWSVRAGQWAYYWLNAQGRVLVARLSRVLLELDHRENRGAAVIAKKVGQYLTLLASRSRRFDMRIGRLLEAVGELPEPEARTKNWAGRTRERFDNAMLMLQEAGVFQTVAWPDGHGPGDQDRTRGWVERWLNARLVGTLPEAPPELPNPPRPALPARGRRGRPRKKPGAEQRIDGETIRQARMERGWRQDELARYLGISRQYLSFLENGKRLPSPDLARKLRAWLAGE